MFEPVDPASLDFRFATECPNCGREAGWTGGVEPRDERTYLDLACTHCGNRFLSYRGDWAARFAQEPRPAHEAGAR